MIQIEFTLEELDALHFERYHHPDPKVQKRMEALYLKGLGLEHGEICRICRLTEPTLVSYLKLYQEGGMEALKHFEYAGQPSELNPHGASLESYFREHPPRSVAEAQSVIKKKTEITRSPSQIQAFLKWLGMKCRKVGLVPGHEADPEKQEEQEKFKTEELEPCLANAKAGKCHVFFVDAAHFVLSACLSKVWCFERLLIASPSGRQRFNVLAAVAAVTKEIFTITNETYIHAESVCLLLTNLAAR